MQKTLPIFTLTFPQKIHGRSSWN